MTRINNAGHIKEQIGKYLLADGMDIIIDLEKSEGSWLVDKRNGDRYLDCFSMFASMAVGFNHPELLAVQYKLGHIAVQKVANSDSYSEPMGKFIETFSTIALPQEFTHLFFIEGGALAVENGLKAAFDWKIKKNRHKKVGKHLGQQVIHFKQAFHGRSGYTLSLTNTADPRKTDLFPKFDWPRIINPKLNFPLNKKSIENVKKKENQAIGEIKDCIKKNVHDIAAIIIEPIQGEGGDNHFRNEFMVALRKICDKNDILLIFDEVQTGVGLTGKFWAYQHFDIVPDILIFGKKTQVCGVMATSRLDEIADNVFCEPSRINSTFGGNLIDMARCSEILKIINNHKLVNNAQKRGIELLQGLQLLCDEFPDVISNCRGKGLMCAFDLKSTIHRDDMVKKLLQKRLLVVGCGEKSIRFRPHLILTSEEVVIIIYLLRNAVQQM